MFNISKLEVLKSAKEKGFNINSYEKVLRLNDILNIIFKSEFEKYLVLKGGTAINLFLLNMPRLSVDIDLDFSINLSKEETQIIRVKIKDYIIKMMNKNGYLLNQHSKFPYSLDSFVFSYKTLSDSNDILKIEINYSSRCHVLNINKVSGTNKINSNLKINILNNSELIASKINALISRTTIRDIYDFYNLIKLNYLSDIKIIKKISLFYLSFNERIPFKFDNKINEAIKRIEKVTYYNLKVSLIPMLNKNEKINLDEMKEVVINKLKEIFVLDEEETSYLESLNNGIFNKDLLFKDYKNINEIENHPLLKYKLNNFNKN